VKTESNSATLAASPLPDDASTRLQPEQRRVVRRCLQALGVLGAGSMVGVAFSLYLVNHYPLVLVALSPLGRHLVLVAPIADPFAFVAVALARRMAFYLVMFHLGRALGPAGITWVEARAVHLGRLVRWIERLFSRASHVVVFVMTGPTVAALAGISGMRARVFLALAIPGLTLRLVFVLGFAEWLREPIEWLLARIDEYWIPGTFVLVTGMIVYQWRRRTALRARSV
jgi:membrane protein DedA with SNARE-associated domain